MENVKKLYLSQTDKIIVGVCGGLGEYFGIDALIFRALFVLFSLSGGAGILVYIVLALVVPKDPHGKGAKDRINELAQQMRDGAQVAVGHVEAHRHHKRHTVGLIIILFGTVLLLSAIFPQSWIRWDIFWPAVVIFAGILILAKK